MTAWESERFDFHNYGFFEDVVSSKVTRCTLRRAEGETADVRGTDVLVDLCGNAVDPDEWEEIRVELELEGRDPASATLWLQALCETTRWEELLPIGGGDGPEMLEVVIPLSQVRGEVLLRPIGVRAGGEDAGLVTSISKGVAIRVDESQGIPGGGLVTRWDAEFFESRGIPGALSFLHFPANEGPILYLNQGIRDFKELMEPRSVRGRVARTRQMLLDVVEADTWIALGKRVAADLFTLEEDGGVTRGAEGTEWQEGVLRKLSGLCAIGRRALAVEEAVQMLLDPEQQETLRCRIHSRVGKGGVGTKLAALIEELGGDQE